jgi:ketosteroid isomerase-like protein
MKKSRVLFVPGLIVLMCLALLAQEPQGRGAGQRGGGRGGRGERGGRGALPPATGPVADATNAIMAAINNQDVTFLRNALAPDAILADEDGHVGVPANVWALRLTTAAKKIAITNLIVGDLGANGAWATFNYTLDETTAKGEPNKMQGSSTIVYSKNGTDLKAVLIQLSVNGRAITPH